MSRTPFSNGFEVEWFRSARCDHCIHDHPEGGGCDEFVIGALVEGGWPDLLEEVPTSRDNPLGVECRKFEKKKAI